MLTLFVYVLMKGENYEGGSIIGVFDCLKRAREAANAQGRKWTQTRKDIWESGWHWMTIERHPILS